MDIREATFPDLPILRDLYRRFNKEMAPRTYPTIDGDEYDAFVRLMAVQLQVGVPQHTFVCLVAWENDVPIGFLAAEICDRAVGRPHHVVVPHFLFVDAQYRKQGVATALIADGFDWLARYHPDVTHTEFFASAQDPQWLDRGYKPFVVRYYRSLDDVRRWKSEAKLDDLNSVPVEEEVSQDG